MRVTIKRIIGCLFVFAFMLVAAQGQNATGRQALFHAMALNSVSALNKQIDAAKKLSGNDKNAFQGALLMRKAGLQKVPAQKMSLFKQGHQLLEAAIGKDAQNAEYRFLRLMIQEHAPKIVGYNRNIAADAQLIKASLKSLPEIVQKAVLSYSKTSKALNGLQ